MDELHLCHGPESFEDVLELSFRHVRGNSAQEHLTRFLFLDFRRAPGERQSDRHQLVLDEVRGVLQDFVDRIDMGEVDVAEAAASQSLPVTGRLDEAVADSAELPEVFEEVFGRRRLLAQAAHEDLADSVGVDACGKSCGAGFHSAFAFWLRRCRRDAIRTKYDAENDVEPNGKSVAKMFGSCLKMWRRGYKRKVEV